jgi:hypothetical protein
VPTIPDDPASAADFADSTRTTKGGDGRGRDTRRCDLRCIQMRSDDDRFVVGGADLLPDRLELLISTLKDDA